MKDTRVVVALITAVTLAADVLVAQRGVDPQPTGGAPRLGGPNGPPLAPAAPGRPVPMLSDGTVDLSGLWTDGGSAPLERLLKPGELKSLMLPWALKLYESRDESLDPYNNCMPGGPLRITGGFAWRLVQHPTVNATHIFMLQEGNAHTYRQIFTDGRKHPEDPTPGWYGHSIGRWEGRTLIVDTIGLHTRFWLDSAGTPHTERLHMVERWTRPEFTTLRREVTIEDPGAFTRPFTATYTARLAAPGNEIMEYFCIENNQYEIPTERPAR